MTDGAINKHMDPQGRTPSRRCPNCGVGNRLTRAKHVVGDKPERSPDADALNPECPTSLVWSVFLYAAIGCALIAAAVMGVSPNLVLPRALDVLLGAAIVLALLSGALGIRNTRKNRELAYVLDPAVRAAHDRAVYCSACACVHFDGRELPAGLRPFEPIPAAEYRWRLWQACGFARQP